MNRFYSVVAVSLVVAFTVVMIVIHTQAYDDHDLRALLIPDDCELPCFMGIRPGVTTVDEAISLLQSSRWVEKVVQKGRSVEWFWNAQAPAFLDGIGSPSLSGLVGNDNPELKVSTIQIPTRLPAGYFYLLRKPISYQIAPPNGFRDSTLAQYVYLSVKFEPFAIRALLGCAKQRLDDFWNQTVELSIDNRVAQYKYWSVWDGQHLQNIIVHQWGC